jgi:aminoglycoside phosphotransferase (APT) family kinase protein
LPDETVNWERSAPPVTLTVDEVEEMLAPWLNGRRVLAVEMMSGGLMNRNFCLHLSGAPEVCVLRVYDRASDACGRERALFHLLRGHVPVPEMFHAQATPADGVPVHAVLSLVNGISLFELRQRGDFDALGESSFDVGRVLARLSDYRFPMSGSLTSTLDVDTGFARGPLSNAGLIDVLMESPLFQQRVDADLRNRIRWFAGVHEPRVAELAATPSLVHGDFNSRNVFVHRTTDGWRVSALLDWEFALAGSPYVDIGNFLRYYRPTTRKWYEPFFSRGLRDGGFPLPDDWLILGRLMDLPACCALLGREHTPAPIVDEVRMLILETVNGPRAS